MAGENKRLHERHSKRLRLRYRAGKNDTWHTAFTQDASVAGLYITANTIPIVPAIEIEIDDDNMKIGLVGTVVRGKHIPQRMRRMIKAGFAVKLHDIPEAWYQFCFELEQKAKKREES